MDFVFGIVIGVLLCSIFVMINKTPKVSGSFIFDLTDPESESIRLEWNESISEIYAKKFVTLEIIVHEDNSQN